MWSSLGRPTAGNHCEVGDVVGQQRPPIIGAQREQRFVVLRLPTRLDGGDGVVVSSAQAAISGE